MADLVNDKIRIRDTFPDDERPPFRQLVRLEVGFERGQEAIAVAGLVGRVGFFFVGREEGEDEEGAPCFRIAAG